MFRMQRTRTISIRLWILFGLLGAVHGLVFAQSGSAEIPDNASAKSYGKGWECDKGYRDVNGVCAVVEVPANAYPTNKRYGSAWECNRGYREVNETCHSIKVPVNGYLTDPSYGVGWKCARGYQEFKDACVEVKMPQNAHLDYSGNDWECNRPFRKQQDECSLH